LDFDNGVSTLDCVRRAPFTEWPLRKFRCAALAVPFAELAGGHLLDIGCNAGYNSIHAALKYQFSTTGVDINPRHIEAARFLAELAGTSSEFELASAETARLWVSSALVSRLFGSGEKAVHQLPTSLLRELSAQLVLARSSGIISRCGGSS
jgi:SAM-dependent methyltransferase